MSEAFFNTNYFQHNNEDRNHILKYVNFYKIECLVAIHILIKRNFLSPSTIYFVYYRIIHLRHL